MKILVLDHPRISSIERFNDIASTPLWSCLMGGYAAAALEKAGDTQYVDLALPGASFQDALAIVFQHNPGLLLVNCVYFWEHTDRLFMFFAALREQNFSGHLNLFGFFPSLVYRDILTQAAEVDSIAVGECEDTLGELANALTAKEPLGDIPGLAVRDGLGTIRYRPRMIARNPDVFPLPVRTAVDSTVSILASRGCYNRCQFCLVPPFDELHGGWRGRSPENIFSEFKKLHARGVTRFYFADPNFIGPGKAGRERTFRLLEMLTPLHITFGMETRPNDLDDALMAALVAAGLTSLLMGVESGSTALLRVINKHSSTEVAAKAIALCRRRGIDPEIGFLMFLPDGSIADIAANFRFLNDNNLLTRLERTANLLCHQQIVLRGTAGYDRYATEGRLRAKGVFGFEGEVDFLDERAAWLAAVILPACHQILRSTGQVSSPLYWKKPDPVFSSELNGYLVNLFASLLRQATAETGLGSVTVLQATIEREIDGMLAHGKILPPLFR